MERRLVSILILCSLPLLACQREGKKNSSSISIQVPRAANSTNKTGGIGSMSAMPSDRKACYGIVVTGGGLTSEQGNACSPPAAIRAGFVEPGGTVEASVPKGSNRTIELFAFLQSPGQTDPCPGFSPSLSADDLLATYKIGSAVNIDMSGDETHVTINADFPGLANHYAQEMGLPASCTAGANPNGVPGFHIGNSRGVASNGSTVLVGGIRAHSGATASNGNLKLKIK